MRHSVTDTIHDSVTEQDYVVDFYITSYGSPPHMGSPSYPGDPGDPPEIEIEGVYSDDGHKEINAADLLERLEEKILQEVIHGKYEPEPPGI